MEEQAKIPVFKASLIYGLIHGLAVIVLSLIFYFIDVSFKTWAIWSSVVVSLGLLVFLLIYLRKEYGKGFIRFGQVVSAAIIISLTSAILSSVYTVAHYSVDESYLQDTKYYAMDMIEKQFEKTENRMMERFSDDEYDRIEDRLKDQKKKQLDKIKDRSPLAFASGNIINSIFMGLIIGLITGAFLKKVPKPEDL